MIRRDCRISPLVCLGLALAVAARASAGVLGLAGGPESFSPGDIGHAVATLAIFAVLLLILRKWAWGPIVNQLRHREQSVADTLDRAGQREQQSQEMLSLYKERLDAAEAEGAELLAQARKEAAQARDRAIQAARNESQQMIDHARQEIDEAKRSAMGELRGATAELAAEIAGQVLRRQLDQAEHERLIAASLDQIRARSAEAG